ncbi:MAG: site-2 protease family protein [Actinomycetota bacterium]
MSAQARRHWSVRIARIAGIDIRVHVTFLLILVLFAFDPNGIVAGLSWLGIVFACVTLHELAHSVVARRYGIPVRSIMLLPIGGVSQIERIPDEPQVEFSIAVVGPLTSFAIAGAFAGVAIVAGTKLLPIDLYGGAFLQRIMWFNVILGGFNLLPAFPMDGGRVLRALLERHRDRVDATRIAALVGRVFAGGMIIFGWLWNVWLAIIGVFIFMGASAEESATVAVSKLKGLTVRDVMLLDPIVVEGHAWIGDLKDLLRRTAQRDFPVVSEGRYVGLLSAETIESASRTVVADEVVNRDIPTLDPHRDLDDVVVSVLHGTPYSSLPVIEHDTVVGLLRQEDIARVLRRPAGRSGTPGGWSVLRPKEDR